ncbi:23096_t:CDS:2, partial [Cetraspora pellucida]
MFLKDLDDDESEMMHKKLLLQIVEIIVSIEELINEDERLDYNYVIKNEQLKAIEDTKVTSKSSKSLKRRKGIVLFIRIFP